MSIASLRHAKGSLRHLVLIWVLAAALPVNGLSGLLVQLFGAQHRHSAAVAQAEGDRVSWSPRALLRAVIGDGAMDVIDAVHARQRGLVLPPPVAQAAAAWAAVPQPAAHVHGPGTHSHGHDHGLYERHHHATGDASVVAIGAQDAGQDAPGNAAGIDAGGAFLLPAMPVAALRLPQAGDAGWARGAAAAWCSHASAPPEPPPRG